MENDLLTITQKSTQVFLGKILGIILAFIFNWLVARCVGAETYGNFIYVYTFISFFPSISMLGLDQALVFFIPSLNASNRNNDLYSLIRFCIALIILVSSILAIIIFLNHNFIAKVLLNNTGYNIYIKVLAPSIIILAISSILTSIFRGFGNISFNIKSDNFINPITKLIVFIFMINLGYAKFSIYISLYISLLFSLIYLFIKYKLMKIKVVLNANCLDTYISALKFGFPILITGILNLFTQRMDIFMIGYFLSSTDVGIYNIATQIATISSFILIAFNTIFAPTISSLYHQGNVNQLKVMYKSITKWVVSINLIAFGIILLFSKDIMNLFGTSFMLGSSSLILISIGQLVNAGTGSVGLINTMTGHPEYEIYISIVIIVFGTLINYFLIPIYGINGAAIASLISISLSNILRLMLVYKNHKLHPYDYNFVKIVISFILALICCSILKNILYINWILKFISISFIYALVFLTFNLLLGISEMDKEIIEGLIARLKHKKN